MSGLNRQRSDDVETQLASLVSVQFHDLLDEALYESDDFRMYVFKIKMCSKTRSHDWTACPFAHKGEKARRRDPRMYDYVGIPCSDYKITGGCLRGDSCHFAHGVFEHWLHPAKYRTRLCNAGASCGRKVCFFAHGAHQLRSETQYGWCYQHGAAPLWNNPSGTSSRLIVPFTAAPPSTSNDTPPQNLCNFERLSLHETVVDLGASNPDQSDPTPDLNWVSELVDDVTNK